MNVPGFQTERLIFEPMPSAFSLGSGTDSVSLPRSSVLRQLQFWELDPVSSNVDSTSLLNSTLRPWVSIPVAVSNSNPTVPAPERPPGFKIPSGNVSLTANTH